MTDPARIIFSALIVLVILSAGTVLFGLIKGQVAFEAAHYEWNVAHDRGDIDAEWKAYHKEEIAHCQTGDFLWFVHDDKFCANAEYR